MPGEVPVRPRTTANTAPTRSTTPTIAATPAQTSPGSMSTWKSTTAAAASMLQAIARSMAKA